MAVSLLQWWDGCLCTASAGFLGPPVLQVLQGVEPGGGWCRLDSGERAAASTPVGSGVAAVQGESGRVRAVSLWSHDGPLIVLHLHGFVVVGVTGRVL